ncbi:disks large-associated protein 5 isoform X1 [Mesocricetus auratus]|uniref:Disks large-associated protein 5 isoform X1 n=1 Tax=Mesocricetus auratus TaxID=10036 RepID=A0A3Q0C8U2_MESAU|nr:disks large-associated protein 5 isoform X1 [Mesocricetus auratus]
MPLSQFANRLRKDLSTEMIRTSIAHRKSISQKENRYKVYERNRHLGVRDVNIPLEGRELVDIHEVSQDCAPERASAKTRSEKVVLSDQRKQLLQKYKEEKQLQKLKEQREKAKRGVFKVGLYRPAAPGFLSTARSSVKAELEKAFPYNGRITRSKARDHMEHTKIDSKNVLQATRSGQRQTSEKKILDKEKKVVQPVVSSGKVTGSAATQRTKPVARTVSYALRKPVTRVVNETESERVGPSRGRLARKVDANPDKVVPSKADGEEASVTSGVHLGGVFPAMESLPETAPAKPKERKSFAPLHCVFQPPSGLKTYQVASVSHRSDSTFLMPSCDQDLLKPEVTTQDAANEIFVQKSITCSTNTAQQESNKLREDLDSPAIYSEEVGSKLKEVSATNSSCLSGEGLAALEVGEGQESQPQHDVPYFRKILQSETDKLTSHCLEWDRKLELDIPDDAKDLIRTAVGQTRLLIKERFKQFEGLVDNCEYKRGEKETTCSDLDGFWDMVSFQVDDVNQKFSNLIKLEEAGWKSSHNPSKTVLRKKAVPGRSDKTKQDDDGRMAARNRLAAIKNAVKQRLKQEQCAQAATAETPKEVEKIVFDAGFFRIESPVKSLSALSSERRSQRFGALTSASRVMPESGAARDLLRQRTSSLENPEPQSSQSERVDRTLFSDSLGSRSSQVEDTLCPGEQDSSARDHDGNEVNVKMDCFPDDMMDFPLPAGGAMGDAVQEGALSDDVLMSNPERDSPARSAPSQEEAAVSQSVPLYRQLTSEHCLLDPPALSNISPCAQLETRQQNRARYISFGGDLIVFSPLRPRSKEHQEGF